MTFDTTPEGEFIRRDTGFRDWVRADGSTPYLPERGRYHLYVSLACPWAHRTVIMRNLKGLQEVIGLSVVDPVWNEQGWYFSDYPGATQDPVNHARDLISIYRLAEPSYDGEETTPVLWDRKSTRIVNNESLEIIRMMDQEFSEFSKRAPDYYPAPLREEIDHWIGDMYPRINNGVYRAGFATSQPAYEKAVKELFAALERYERHLSTRRYLCGSRMTEADLCLFTTLLRFDPVYAIHFKCTLRRLIDFPNLWGFTRDLYQTPGVAETCNLDHIKRHYFMSHSQLNPTRIVPLGPELDLNRPHDRQKLGERSGGGV